MEAETVNQCEGGETRVITTDDVKTRRNKGWPTNGYPKWLLGREVYGVFYIVGGSDHWLIARWLAAHRREKLILILGILSLVAVGMVRSR